MAVEQCLVHVVNVRCHDEGSIRAFKTALREGNATGFTLAPVLAIQAGIRQNVGKLNGTRCIARNTSEPLSLWTLGQCLPNLICVVLTGSGTLFDLKDPFLTVEESKQVCIVVSEAQGRTRTEV